VQIISGDQGGIVRLWTISNWSCERILEGHSGPIRGVAFSGRAMVSCSQDETLRVWDLSTGAVRAKLVGHDCDVRAVAAAVDGRVAVSCGFDGIIRMWDLHAGKETGSITTGHTDKVTFSSEFSWFRV
jgi:WD40 repeat protein